MKIKILAFGIAKEIIGNNLIEFEIKENTSVKILKESIVKKFPKLNALKHFNIAVNQNYVKDDFIIEANNEIVILPPVSGG